MSAPARTYEAARSALYALAPRGVVLGTEAVARALRARGDPQRRVRVVHIAGTNGKGSVAAMVDAGLRAAGHRVGLYTSPHLHRFAERVRVGGAPADEATLGACAWAVLDGIERGELPALTFFEATTVIAWEVFARTPLDYVVLEVGLGGRLDATNVCEPVRTAITRIARDHEAMLGDSLAQIAEEKAGILKPGVTCVLGPDLRSGEARDAIERVAVAKGAVLEDAPRHRVVALSDELRARVVVAAPGGALELELALTGEHQAGNAAVAVGLLLGEGVPREAVRDGLAATVWPGRMERVGALLLDAAHNPDGAAALSEALDRLPGDRADRALVFGASSDKDWRRMLDALARHVPAARRFYCAAALRRAEDPSALAAYGGGLACASVDEALARARACVSPAGVVVVCGSIFVVAAARAAALGMEEDPPVAL